MVAAPRDPSLATYVAPLWHSLTQLHRFHRQGQGWIACCPAHDDRNPSLSIGIGADNQILLLCHARCSTEMIVSALGAKMADLWPLDARRATLRAVARPPRRLPPVTTRYEMRDQAGALYTHVRKDYLDKFGQPYQPKQVWWEPGGVRVAEMPLWRVDDLLDAPVDAPVYVCEGERTTEVARKAGLLAVGTVTGASSTPCDESLRPLLDHLVVLWPDHDEAGRGHMQRLAERLLALGQPPERVQQVAWHDAPPKGDAADYFALGGTVATLQQLVTRYALPCQNEADEAPDTSKSHFQPVGVRMSEVEPVAVRWLWPGYIPLGKLTGLDGDPGLGKSTITADWISCVTRGNPWPDGTRCETGGVVLLSAEDDDADTIRPRLDAAGADPARVYHLTGVTALGGEGDTKERDVYLPADIPVIEAEIRAMSAKLVIIDPLMAFLSSDVNSYRDQDVRGALRPLAALASRTGAAIVLVRHLNKMSGGPALYRGGGSIGIIGAVRAGLLVAPDPDDPDSGKPGGRRVLAVVKTNLGVEARSLTFHVRSADSNPAVGVIEWGAVSSRTANDLVSQPRGEEERSLTDEAAEYLQSALADGPRPIDEVRNEAPRELQAKALRRAAERLHIMKTRIGFGKGSHSEWSLPTTIENLAPHRCPPNPIDAHQNQWASMADEGIYGDDLGSVSACERPTNCARRRLANGRVACGLLCEAMTTTQRAPL